MEKIHLVDMHDEKSISIESNAVTAWAWLRVLRTGKYPDSEMEAARWAKEEYEAFEKQPPPPFKPRLA